jgi:hypothetical protein
MFYYLGKSLKDSSVFLKLKKKKTLKSTRIVGLNAVRNEVGPVSLWHCRAQLKTLALQHSGGGSDG